MKLRSIVVIFALACTSCGRDASPVLNPASQYGPHPLPGAEGEQFEAMTFRVVDEKTGSPLAEAVVQVMCLGDTPYKNRSYVTDAKGVVTVVEKKPMEGQQSVVFVKVAKDGYGEIVYGVSASNPVVPLKRLL